MTEVVVVRHGETVWNREGKQQGHLDSPLTELGLAQAEAIAEALSGAEFDALYSSDLGRAMYTAEAISRRTGKAVISDPRLRERHLGVFQTLTMKEVEERFPQEYRRFKSGDIDYAIPGGESIRQRYDRCVACVSDLARRHSGARIVVVTHGGILDGLFRRAVGVDPSAPRRFKLYNASINTLFLDGDDWRLGTWGDISHLKGLGTHDDW